MESAKNGVFTGSLAAKLPYNPHVLVLAIDTASPSGSIAVLRDQEVSGVISTTSEETYSSRMFRQLEFLLAELGLAQNQFDLYAVNAGPGSFTGLRVGITAAKGWAEVYGKPVAGVSGLEAVARQYDGGEIFVPVIDARRGQVYFGFYRREGARLMRDGDERVATPEEFVSALMGHPEYAHSALVTCDQQSLAQITLASPAGMLAYHQVSSVLAPVIGRIAYERAKRGETVDALMLDANYVRRSDAELHWKGPS